MFFGLALTLFGLAWLLYALGVYSAQSFHLVGSVLLIFAGMLKLMNMRKGRKADSEF